MFTFYLQLCIDLFVTWRPGRKTRGTSQPPGKGKGKDDGKGGKGKGNGNGKYDDKGKGKGKDDPLPKIPDFLYCFKFYRGKCEGCKHSDNHHPKAVVKTKHEEYLKTPKERRLQRQNTLLLKLRLVQIRASDLL